MPEGGNIPPDPNNPGGRVANDRAERLRLEAEALIEQLRNIIEALARDA